MKNDVNLESKTRSGWFESNQCEAGKMSRKDIDDLIKKQSEAGKSTLVKPGHLSGKVANSLKNDGFRVDREWDSESGMYWSSVSWGKVVEGFGNFLKISAVIIIAALFIYFGLK